MTTRTLDTADWLAVHQLLARYGHLVDARDWRAFADLFAEDAIFDATVYGVPAVRGRASITEWFAAARHPAAHHCTNIEVHLDGDAVRVHSKWLVGYPDGTTGGGDYHDQVAGNDGTWRFLVRRVVRRWPDPQP